MPRASSQRFGRGYKKDPHDARDLSSDRALGLPTRIDLVVAASMMAYRGAPLVQGAANSCVAHALTRALDMALRHQRRLSLGAEDLSPPLASRRFIYFNARQREIIESTQHGQPANPMVDEGAYPRLTMRAVQKLGFCPESLFPYSDDPMAINARPPPSSFRAAVDQSGLRYYRVFATGKARVAEVSRAIAAGKPVIFGMIVDSAVMDWPGEAPIDTVNVADPEAGGHMMCVLAVDTDKIVADNWWGESWGARGLMFLDHALFGTNVVSDVYVIEAAPTFSIEESAP